MPSASLLCEKGKGCTSWNEIARCRCASRRLPSTAQSKRWPFERAPLGDGFQHLVVAWLLGHLAVQLGYLSGVPSFQELRLGQVAQYHTVADRGISGGMPIERALSDEKVLVRRICSRATLRGSDVRLATGELNSPHNIPRQSLDGRFWRWRSTVSVARRYTAHINILELQCVLTALKRRARKPSLHCRKYLHLFDRQVTLSAMSKRRSSSRILTRVLRKANAITLATGIRPIFVFICSDHNPADRPSRRVRSKYAE